MRKFIAMLMGIIMMMSLWACTPTQPSKNSKMSGPQVTQPTGGASDKVPDANAEPMEIISVYSKSNDGSGLNQAMDAVDQLTAEALVGKLIEYGILEEGTTVVKYEAKDGVGTLDLSKMPIGKESDLVLLTAVGNTFIENLSLDKLKLLVNGENYSGDQVQQGDDDFLEYVKNYSEIG